MTWHDALTFARNVGGFFGGVAISVAISAVIGLDIFVLAIACLLPFVVGVLPLQERHGRWPYKSAKH